MSYLDLLDNNGYGIFLGRRRKLLCIEYNNEYISVFDDILDIESKFSFEEYGIEKHISCKRLVKIKTNSCMIHKNDIILPFPKNEKQAELIFDVIISLLKEQPFRLFKVDNRKRYNPKKQSYINKKLEELNIWNHYYHWSGMKASGTFVKQAWSFESDSDVYEYMTSHDISKMKRRAGRKYIEHNKWENNYGKRVDVKRYKKNIIANKKLT